MHWIRCFILAAFALTVMPDSADGSVHYSDSALFVLDTVTAVDHVHVPTVAAIVSVYPNPFNPSTTIRFATSGAREVRIAIYDLRGRMISPLIAGTLDAGSHEAVWQGRDSSGRNIPSGMYFCRLVSGNTTQIRKLVLVR